MARVLLYDNLKSAVLEEGAQEGEIPMESFARAVEVMLKSCWDVDSKHERPDQGRWVATVKACGYV